MRFWIEDIRTQLGVTVLMVEHNMSLVSAVSDRVLVSPTAGSSHWAHPGRCSRCRGRRGLSRHRHGNVMSDPLLEVRNLECFYGPVMALRGVSLRVPEGQAVAVLGGNGAGKTTLLRTVSGIMDAEKGEVLLSGESIAGTEPDRIVRGGLVHVPEGREVFPLLTVEENLAMGAYTRRDDGVSEDAAAVFDYFPVLRERIRQPAGTLSGGEQQMLAIARALMARPRIMLLDEPSLGLSPVMVRDIFAIIRRLKEERGVTMLLVEQNAAMALDVADFGYVLENGQIVMDGPAERLKRNADIREFYLGARTVSPRGDRRWKRRKTWRS